MSTENLPAEVPQRQSALSILRPIASPKDLLEYVIVHEMMHLLEPTHSPRFFDLMSEHYPSWPEARRELNELPLSDELLLRT